jgi:hypothetical protein
MQNKTAKTVEELSQEVIPSASMISAGVSAFERFLLENALTPLSREPAVLAVWASMNKAAIARRNP